MDYIYFYCKWNLEKATLDDKVVFIPKNITSELQLFRDYEKLLNIPVDFGKNWDAFFDNLKGFDFIEERNVHVVHEDFPFSNNPRLRITYIEILTEAIQFWWDYPQHKFYVYFPENCKEEVMRIINTRSYD